jgi:hypothetical protein
MVVAAAERSIVVCPFAFVLSTLAWSIPAIIELDSITDLKIF